MCPKQTGCLFCHFKVAVPVVASCSLVCIRVFRKVTFPLIFVQSQAQCIQPVLEESTSWDVRWIKMRAVGKEKLFWGSRPFIFRRIERTLLSS
jgi:hypothetical protein